MLFVRVKAPLPGDSGVLCLMHKTQIITRALQTPMSKCGHFNWRDHCIEINLKRSRFIYQIVAGSH